MNVRKTLLLLALSFAMVLGLLSGIGINTTKQAKADAANLAKANAPETHLHIWTYAVDGEDAGRIV